MRRENVLSHTEVLKTTLFSEPLLRALLQPEKSTSDYHIPLLLSFFMFLLDFYADISNEVLLGCSERFICLLGRGFLYV